MKGRPCWLPTWLNWYRLRRHRRRSERQRRFRRRNMDEFVLSSSSTTKRTTKTPPQAQQWLNRIGFVVIDNRANDKDAAAGVVAATVPDDTADWMCHVPCAMYRGTTTDDAIYRIARATRTSNDDVECTKKHENYEKHERAILVLCNWCMKEQYYFYPINTLK